MSQEAKCSLNTTVGKRIKFLRQYNNWHQPIVAGMLKITVSSYSKIETGCTDLNFSRLTQIAEIYQVDITELLSENAREEIKRVQIPLWIRKRITESDDEIVRLKEKINDLEKQIQQIPKRV
jgi:transcriptional regulator with XRE-family HTH domain